MDSKCSSFVNSGGKIIRVKSICDLPEIGDDEGADTSKEQMRRRMQLWRRTKLFAFEFIQSILVVFFIFVQGFSKFLMWRRKCNIILNFLCSRLLNSNFE